MASHPELDHLVPLLHALGADPTDLFVDREGTRLFEHDQARYDHGDSSTGTPQGMGLSSVAFAVALHPELCALDAELRATGGFARAIMDDVYACGPASMVFAAIDRFAEAVEQMLGMELQMGKLECYSAGYDLSTCPWRERHGVRMGGSTSPDGTFHPGILVGGAPVGSDSYVCRDLLARATEIAQLVETTCAQLADDEPQSCWTAIVYSLQPRFDFWLRHCAPRHTELAARVIDGALEMAVARVARADVSELFGDAVLEARIRLPARHRGCGIRSRVWLRWVAFAACTVECAERMTGPGGFFPSLSAYFPHGVFAPGGIRFTPFIAGGSPLAQDFEQSWMALSQSVSGQGVPGPLDRRPWDAGASRGTVRLQHEITAQVEQIRRRSVHAYVLGLVEEDPRREAWFSVDELSSQWVTAWPGVRHRLSRQEFPEVFSTYLGTYSPVLRPYEGRSIPCATWRGPAAARYRGRICDAHGHQLALSCLPFDGWTACHDGCGEAVLQMFRDSGVRMVGEPSSIFSSLIPAAVLLARDQPPAIIPDSIADLALPPSVTARGVRQAQRTEPSRQHLIDFKCAHAGNQDYTARRGREDQSGAVAHRAHREWATYTRSARELDTRFHAPRTPVYDRLCSFGRVRCLVFGAYGEASPDVHHCIRAAARRRAEREWRLLGARTEAEAYACFMQQYRRDVGLAAVREHARLRLSRVPFIGVSHEVVAARGDQRRRAPVRYARDASAFYAFQARADGVAGQAGGGA